jgi:hypothetical protein
MFAPPWFPQLNSHKILVFPNLNHKFNENNSFLFGDNEQIIDFVDAVFKNYQYIKYEGLG